MVTAVVTSINAYTPALASLHASLRDVSMPLIVVGDRKGPAACAHCDLFLSLEDQLKLPYALAGTLPEGHYSRKNLGYLHAIQDGADLIYETDDDNYPTSWWHPLWLGQVDVRETIGNDGWCNAYTYFTDESIWPRGLSLREIQTKPMTTLRQVWSPVRQGLANGSPDVDAIWRLTQNRDIRFDERDPVALSSGVYCPFNSQNTWWDRPVFPLLYLPSFVPFRMTDIWRSFIALRCMQEIGAHLTFWRADVQQDRNDHDLMADFGDEVAGYLQNERIVNVLRGLKLQPGIENLGTNLYLCYWSLVQEKLMDPNELQLLSCWLRFFKPE